VWLFNLIPGLSVCFVASSLPGPSARNNTANVLTTALTVITAIGYVICTAPHRQTHQRYHRSARSSMTWQDSRTSSGTRRTGRDRFLPEFFVVPEALQDGNVGTCVTILDLESFWPIVLLTADLFLHRLTIGNRFFLFFSTAHRWWVSNRWCASWRQQKKGPGRVFILRVREYQQSSGVRPLKQYSTSP
jgi:hypothetical protein